MLNWQALIGHIYKIIECGSPKHHVVVVLWTFCVYVIWEGPKFLDWRGGLDVGQEKKQAEVQNVEGKAGLDVERERKQAACGCLLLIQK